MWPVVYSEPAQLISNRVLDFSILIYEQNKSSLSAGFRNQIGFLFWHFVSSFTQTGTLTWSRLPAWKFLFLFAFDLFFFRWTGWKRVWRVGLMFCLFSRMDVSSCVFIFTGVMVISFYLCALGPLIMSQCRRNTLAPFASRSYVNIIWMKTNFGKIFLKIRAASKMWHFLGGKNVWNGIFKYICWQILAWKLLC